MLRPWRRRSRLLPLTASTSKWSASDSSLACPSTPSSPTVSPRGGTTCAPNASSGDLSGRDGNMNNDWWNWFGWLWAVSVFPLYWVLPVVALAAALAAHSHHERQRASAGTARRLQHDAETPGHGPGLTGAMRWLILGDGLTTALGRRLARVQRQIGRLGGQLAAVEMSLVELAPAVQELQASAGELGSS